MSYAVEGSLGKSTWLYGMTISPKTQTWPYKLESGWLGALIHGNIIQLQQPSFYSKECQISS